MGKIIGKDFYEGKITYPVIHCYKKSNSTNKNKLRKIFLKNKRSKNDFNKTLLIMNSTNTCEESINFLDKYLKKAKSSVLQFEGLADKVYLDVLVNYLRIRDK